MQPDRRPLFGTLAVLVAAACFGTLGPLSRLAYEAGMTPLGFVTWRAAVGAVVVGGLVLARMRRGRPYVGLRRVGGRARMALIIVVVSGIVLNLAIFTAFDRITVALAVLGFYTYPAMVTAAITMRERRRPDAIHLGALVMALVGMAVVVLGQLDPSAGVRFDSVGFGLALVAAVAQTVFVLVSRRGFVAVPTDEATLAVLGGGALGFLLLAIGLGDAAAVLKPFGTPAVWPYLLFGGLVGAGIPSLLFLTGVRRIGGVRTGILAMFEPVTATVLAALILGEALRPIQVLGGALVLGAGVLLQRSPMPRGALGAPSAEASTEPDAEPIPTV